LSPHQAFVRLFIQGRITVPEVQLKVVGKDETLNTEHRTLNI
jgi:hypothetical protein